MTNNHTGHLGQVFAATVLPTNEVHVKTPSCKLETCRASLDTGSDSSFISEQCVQKLTLPRRKSIIGVTGISGTSTVVDHGTSYLQLVDRMSRVHQVSAFILPKLTSLLPSKSIKVPANINIQSYEIEFSDPNFYKSGKIDIILGKDIYEKKLDMSESKSQETCLLAKRLSDGTAPSKDSGNAQVFRASVDSVDFQLQQFWEIEELPQRSMWTREESDCNEHFCQNTRIENNRFVVKLPFKSSMKLGESLSQAKRRFNHLENRLNANPELKKAYKAFIDYFIDMQHMEVVPEGALEVPF